MDTYVLYGQQLDAIYVQKNNEYHYLDSVIEGVPRASSHRVELKDGETILTSWTIDGNYAKGHWEFASDFSSYSGVSEYIKLVKDTTEGSKSDQTVVITIPSEYDLEFTKLS